MLNRKPVLSLNLIKYISHSFETISVFNPHQERELFNLNCFTIGILRFVKCTQTNDNLEPINKPRFIGKKDPSVNVKPYGQVPDFMQPEQAEQVKNLEESITKKAPALLCQLWYLVSTSA